MLHQPPIALTDAVAASSDVDDPLLGIAGGTTAPVRKAEVDCSVAPNTKIWSKAGGGTATLLPEDIPHPDDGKRVPYEPSEPRKPPFVHKPVITRRVGDRIEVVTGPVTPVVPHTDETTVDGWKLWHAARDRPKAAVIEKAKKVAAEARSFWQAREDKNDADYQAKCKHALEKGRPVPKRPKKTPPPPGWELFLNDPELVKHINDSRHAAQRKNRIRCARLSGRFAGRDYAPVVEKFHHEDGTPAPALRGWLNLLSFELFNSSLEKGRGVTYGLDKTVELTGRDRIWALDASHVVKDKCRLSGFVADIDGWKESLEVLRAELRTKLPIEFMPNIITHRGREEDGAGADGAHLEWLLPPGARVIGFGNPKQRHLHEMIQKAIVDLLIDIGADGGHTNTNKTKNCLAVGWSAEVCDDHFQTMDAWRKFLPSLDVDRRDMIRRTKQHKAKNQQSGAQPKESSPIWNDGVVYRRLEIKTAQATQDPAFLSAVRKCRPGKVSPFVAWLYHRTDGVMTRRLIDLHGDTRAVRSVLAAQREFVIELSKIPSEVGEFCNRGRDADLNKDLPPLPPTASAAERKARRDLIKSRAGTSTQHHKFDNNCGRIAEAIELRLSSGLPVVKAEIVKELVSAGSVKRSTAYARFDDVLLTVQQAARYQVHSNISKPAHPSQPVESFSSTVFEEPESSDRATQLALPVRIPVKTNVYPAWVVDKDSLTVWEEACRMRDEWSIAVAASRNAAARRRPKAGVDLAADPEFRALVLGRTSWAGRRSSPLSTCGLRDKPKIFSAGDPVASSKPSWHHAPL